MRFETNYYGTLLKKAKKPSPTSLIDRFTHLSFRAVLWCYIIILKLAKRFRPQQPFPKNGPVEILLTGTFFSDNWIVSLLRPLTLSKRCGRIRMVSSTPVPTIEKVEPVYPSKFLTKLIGRSPARLTTFLWLGFRTRPHIVGGFHLLINGLIAILLARLIGAKSLYSCCGGPIECEGGGYKADNHLFSHLSGPDQVIEHHLLDAVAAADLVITRGNLAIRFFREHGIETQFHVVPGGMDGEEFAPSGLPAEYDLITVGNLIPRKRVDLFLNIINVVRASRPNIRAVILGDGPLREELENQARDLNLTDSVHFAGHQKEVANWLRRAKIFVLTSESEGLSQAMIQAMLSGLPIVASHVGEAEDLVKNGINGFLVPDWTAASFAGPIIQLLEDVGTLAAFAKAARLSAEKYDVHSLARRWDEILIGLAD